MFSLSVPENTQGSCAAYPRLPTMSTLPFSGCNSPKRQWRRVDCKETNKKPLTNQVSVIHGQPWTRTWRIQAQQCNIRMHIRILANAIYVPYVSFSPSLLPQAPQWQSFWFFGHSWRIHSSRSASLHSLNDQQHRNKFTQQPKVCSCAMLHQ